MPAVEMKGKEMAAARKDWVRNKVEAMDEKPGLAVILVGDNPASRVYADGKRRDCAQCGIYSEEYILPERTTEAELLDLIDALNERKAMDGILIQMPLPDHIDARRVLTAVRPDKDIDCFHPFNMGQLVFGEEGFRPCTPSAVMAMLEEYGIDPAGKSCVIVGRSNIVGKPLAMLMVNHDATFPPEGGRLLERAHNVRPHAMDDRLRVGAHHDAPGGVRRGWAGRWGQCPSLRTTHWPSRRSREIVWSAAPSRNSTWKASSPSSGVISVRVRTSRPASS